MRVLLVNPPFYRFLNSSYSWASLGPAYVGSALARAGHRVRIINLDRPPRVRFGELRAIFRAAAGYVQATQRADHPVWEELRQALLGFLPHAVGVTVTTPTLVPALTVARTARTLLPRAMLVAGGPHATVAPEDLVGPAEGFDVAVRGEGEAAAVELLAAPNNTPATVAGTVRASKDGPIHGPERDLIPNLDTVTAPDLTLYAHPPATDVDFGLVAGSRGCPGQCVFCASPVIWRRRLRLRSPESIVDEVVDRVNRLGAGRIYFVDDQWNCDLDRAKRLAGLLAGRCPGLRWVCECRVKPMDDELAELMRRAGCVRVKLGVESGSDRVLRSMNKGATVADAREMVDRLRRAGLPFSAYVLLGMPGEGPDEAQATADLIEDIRPEYVSISVATPHPGTALAAGGGFAGPPTAFHQSIDPSRVYVPVLERLLAYNETAGRRRL